MLGPDPLTTSLLWFAFVLTAAIAALGVDLWLWPGHASPAMQASAARESTRLAIGSTVEYMRGLLSVPSTAPVLALSPVPSPSPIESLSEATNRLPALIPAPTQGLSAAPSPSPILGPNPAAVRIRIPAIGVDRSIIEIPLTYDSRSGSWTRDYNQLFRQGRQDLVGHLAESALPGQSGTMILAGHNYGYGTNGVFLRLERLRVGDRVQIVNGNGRTFGYRVTEVTSIPWTNKDQQELLRHSAYLSFDGPERLTLVTCGGSSWAPFPERVYVVAAPAN